MGILESGPGAEVGGTCGDVPCDDDLGCWGFILTLSQFLVCKFCQSSLSKKLFQVYVSDVHKSEVYTIQKCSGNLGDMLLLCLLR